MPFLRGYSKMAETCATNLYTLCNQSAIGKAYSNMYNGKSRHIHRRHKTIRELLLTRIISIDYVKSKDNITDPLTKGLNRELVEKSSKGIS